MSNTTHLQMPLLEAAQAQKHVTVNEALQALDAVVQLAVKDKDLTTPPGSPNDGDRYIVGPSATGDWASEDGNIAAYQDGVWVFYDPREGWLTWIDDENELYAYDGSSWSVVTSSSSGSVLKPLPTISNNSADAHHDIDISAGDALDVAGSQVIALTSSLTKRIDAAWSVGSNAGGLDTGSVAANTAYAVWLIRRSDTGGVDALFSTSFSSGSVTLPTHYDALQLIGWVATDGSSNIYTFEQSGDHFELYRHPLVLTDSSITDATWETATLSELPPRCVANLTACHYSNATSGSPTAYFWARMKGASKSITTFNQHVGVFAAPNGTWGIEGSGQFNILLDGSSRFEYAASEAASTVTTISIHLLGCQLTERGAAS